MNTLERLKRHLDGLPERKPIIRKSLLELGPLDEVDAALNDLVAEGTLMCATEGVFAKPHTSEFGTWIGFGAWEAAKAFCENEGHAIGLTPMEWANAIHLSTQVVAKPTYLTDGPTRDVPFGTGRTIHFIHASLRDMRLTQTVGGGAILGLEWARPPYPMLAVRQLAKDLGQEDFAAFLQEAAQEGGWIAKAARAYETAFGHDAGDCVLDLDNRRDRDCLNHGFAEAFREHDERREAYMEALKQHLASLESVEKEGGHEA